MDLLSKHKQTNTYCNRIITSSYLQDVSKKTTSVTMYPTLIHLFLSRFDPHCELVENKDKQMYIKQLTVDIATKIDEDKDNCFDKYRYNKKMNTTLIQQGLQSMNSLSALLYLSDYYNVTTHLFIEASKKKIVTSQKEREPWNIMYANNKWFELENDSLPEDYSDGVHSDIGVCLTLDVKTLDVYQKYLEAIGKYKSDQLTEIAKKLGIPLECNGKKKVKKVLYDEINVYQLNHPTS